MNILGIFVKHPVAGEVKTRLASAIGMEQAAALYAAFVADLAQRFRETADERYLCFTPDTKISRAYFREIAGDSYKLWPQPASSLGERMQTFFEQAFQAGASRVVVIGSDSPTLPATFLTQAFDRLEDRDCVIGPATDGGYYLIGLRTRPLPLFDPIDWSTPRVFEQTLSHIKACGSSLGVLPPWYDVDSLEDLSQLHAQLRALQRDGKSSRAPRTEAVLATVEGFALP